MTPDVIEQVFEPFFTTKPEGQGTGLGLSMVYGFVKQSGGHVKIYSEPGHGTTIRLYLPRIRQAEDVTTEVEQGPAVGGTETVLVVEDDEDVRNTVVDLLSDLGYRVLRAKDAQGALAIVESGVAIDLLFTDVVMPGPLRSRELARKTRERLPDVAVLFTSGYTDNAIVHGGRLDEGIELLSKPYTREALARKIRHVLGDQQKRSLSKPAKASMPATRPEASSGDKALRVLLVEDDGLIRLATADMLEELGHTVFEASHAAEALEILERERIDVLLTDDGLPGISGRDLAIQVRQRRPATRIIFASGRSIVSEASPHETLKNATQLLKPYDIKGLKAALDGSAA
jgi:CheY-like chemotaxis protein